MCWWTEVSLALLHTIGRAGCQQNVRPRSDRMIGDADAIIFAAGVGIPVLTGNNSALFIDSIETNEFLRAVTLNLCHRK